ncbi:Spy/CpxP family protein refolding chaperone [Variovorax sp. PBL-E5]|uniref:Spy/CpxP family protein refolding chaperone n=1 Tax=Variovorax sp. PBL-E5 TaxID=434014 RepID=UPI0013191DD2|nr:Spy/CpxP family protein refolding chaperone [Variovorax sp. PBL-E5]VTU35873.1 hypothetical protein E5CHR_04173 [Variovorax sp. PBL-E5]
MTRLRQKFAFAIVLAALSGHSFAQFGGGGMGGGRRGHSGDAPAASRSTEQASSPEMRANQIRDKLYDLRLRLLITPEQAALWDGFYNKVWDLAVKNSLAHAPAADDLTAVQALQQRVAEAQERAGRLQEIGDAAARLYAALTPDQRRVADQYLPPALP